MLDAALIEKLLAEVAQEPVDSPEQAEAFRLAYLSKKGRISALFDEFRALPPEEKRALGQPLNVLKKAAEERFQEAQSAQKAGSNGKADSSLDLSLPGVPHQVGSLHPLTLVRRQIQDIFARLGFSTSEGPEIEDDWHNFTALGFPPDHPAREMQDTFFVEKDPDIALRTHTSSVQIRVMEAGAPPFRTLGIGRVYRNEAISARAHCFFHQVEGFYVDKNVSMLDLRDTLMHFVKEFYGDQIGIRFRPSYFPFTEPSAEVDINCLICHGDGCNVCKHTGYVEIGGAGMIDPVVLEKSGIDPNEYSGFAFGMGLERMAMLRYQINDLRLFSENDVRFLRQFVGENK